MTEETTEQHFAKQHSILDTMLTPSQKDELVNFDAFEQSSIADFMGMGQSYEQAIAVYGNSTGEDEGADLTQLSEPMQKAYKKYVKYGRVRG